MYPYFYPSYFTPLEFRNENRAIPKINGQNFGTTSSKPVESVPKTEPHMEPPVDFTMGPVPSITQDIGYTQGFLKKHIGEKCKIEFLIGTNSLTDRIGTLIEVGISYVVLRLVESDDEMMGDLYSIKFVTFYK